MKKIDQLDALLQRGNGYILISDALALDISAPYVYDFVAKRSLCRVASGLYKSDDAWEDELYAISILNQRVCFSHETALFLNELMEREPFEITVSAPRGYNASHLRKRKIRVFQLREEQYLIGKTSLETPRGHRVAAYDKERAICDLLRNKVNTDIQIFQTAFRLYVERTDKNIPLLMRYANAFNLEKEMRKYMEVLL
ncbi:MAG: abortive phage infection protein [Trichococcus flocculiformis]|uniref:Abortive phage infection protein n=1 Tax=Trichococcus flocculiformis TaxID=82803 RepID=A0A847D6E9_9LACT|nr:abortive phage infection protein [Trichococcus flocculiformis]NLD32057.1 abortive phage infection protein [Trichococcus flocculiformis]